MSDPYFFGYGSLVNYDTHMHHYPDPQPATLVGWRRAWVGSPSRRVVLLSAIPSPGDAIQGLLASVPDGDWTALDIREAGYDRVWTTDIVDHRLTHNPPIAVYSVNPEKRHPTHNQIILMSYLDVVVQGFVRVFGEEGVQGFFDTTDGWHTPILNDRSAPIYPRHKTLTAEETALVDHHVARIKATVQEMDVASDTHEF
jgi:hypothetical protein